MARAMPLGGAGQSGLQLGSGLLDAGYGVTLVSNRMPEQIRAGSLTSSQGMFAQTLGARR